MADQRIDQLTEKGFAQLVNADWWVCHSTADVEARRVAMTSLLARLLTTTDRTVLGTLAAIGSIDLANDELLLWDNSATAFVRMTADQLVGRILQRAHITGMTNLTASSAVDATSDRFLVWDASAGGFRTLTAGVIMNALAAGTENSVLAAGARADDSMACLSIFQACAAAIVTRGGEMIIDEDYVPGVAYPCYRVGGNWLASLGTAGLAMPGGTTKFRGRVSMTGSSRVILPAGHVFQGHAGLPTNVNDAGGDIVAHSSFTDSVLVQLGATGTAPQHTKLNSMTVNGRNTAGSSNLVGVFSDTIQEASGLYDTAVIHVHHGVVIVPGDTVTPSNFAIERSNIVLSKANGGDGLYIAGGNCVVTNQTVVNTHTTTNGDTAYTLRGMNKTLIKGHFEGFDYGLDIGGPVHSMSGSKDLGYWTRNITVQSFGGYCLSTQPVLQAVVRLRNNENHLFNVRLQDLSINELHLSSAWAASTPYTLGARRTIAASATVGIYLECTTAGTSGGSEPAVGTVGATVADGTVTWTYRRTLLVQDQVNGIEIPALAVNNVYLAEYRFGGTLGVDSGTAQKRPVYTTFYDRYAPPNRALIARTISGATATLDRQFEGGGFAGIVQITSTSGPTLQNISDPHSGSRVLLHFYNGGATIDHNNGGTAELRMICSTGSDITAAQGSYYWATYGDIRGAAIDGTNYASRWYVEAV